MLAILHSLKLPFNDSKIDTFFFLPNVISQLIKRLGNKSMTSPSPVRLYMVNLQC